MLGYFLKWAYRKSGTHAYRRLAIRTIRHDTSLPVPKLPHPWRKETALIPGNFAPHTGVFQNPEVWEQNRFASTILS